MLLLVSTVYLIFLESLSLSLWKERTGVRNCFSPRLLCELTPGPSNQVSAAHLFKRFRPITPWGRCRSCKYVGRGDAAVHSSSPGERRRAELTRRLFHMKEEQRRTRTPSTHHRREGTFLQELSFFLSTVSGHFCLKDCSSKKKKKHLPGSF